VSGCRRLHGRASYGVAQHKRIEYASKTEWYLERLPLETDVWSGDLQHRAFARRVRLTAAANELKVRLEGSKKSSATSWPASIATARYYGDTFIFVG